MIRYTTPTFEAYVRGQDLSGTRVQFTVRQGSREVTKDTQTSDDIEVTYDGTDTRIDVFLAQEESGRFKEGVAEVQVNWETNGRRLATTVKEIPVGKQLLPQVVV